MNAETAHECELVSRVSARWCSVAAAVIFGVGFLTDDALSYDLVTGQIEQIALVLLTFVGYLLAWRNRYEALGSAIALASVAAYWIWCRMQLPNVPNPIFLAIAAPALLHLAAVSFCRLRSSLRNDRPTPQGIKQ